MERNDNKANKAFSFFARAYSIYNVLFTAELLEFVKLIADLQNINQEGYQTPTVYLLLRLEQTTLIEKLNNLIETLILSFFFFSHNKYKRNERNQSISNRFN